MYSREELYKLVEAELCGLSFPEEPKKLYQPIVYTLSRGGKRLRPILLLMAADAFGGKVEEGLHAAAAVEIFHNFTLLHDDIMDHAQTRRGEKCVHVLWGDNVAILSGDTMLMIAYNLLASGRLSCTPRLLEVFGRFSVELCEGQQYDMDFEERAVVSLEEYLMMIRLKTSVLIAGALEMGALIGGASEEECRKIAAFGSDLGIAFQLQDDLLDSYGDPDTFGKKIGGDIVEGKRSALLVLALSRASVEDRQRLLQLIADKEMEPQRKIGEVKEIYAKYKIKEECEALTDDYFRKAMEALRSIGSPRFRGEQLAAFAGELMKRER